MPSSYWRRVIVEYTDYLQPFQPAQPVDIGLGEGQFLPQFSGGAIDYPKVFR